MPTPEIRIDDRYWPLVVVTFEGAATATSFARFLARMDSYLEKKERHLYLLDGRDGAMMGAPERAAQGAWLKKNKEELKRYSAGTALVVRSAAVRFVLSAMYLVQAPVTPTETFHTVDDAYAWLEKCAKREGIRLPTRDKLPA